MVVGVGVWGVEGFRGELTTERWHVVGVDFKIVYEDSGVVNGGGEGVRGAHVTIDDELQVVGAGGEGDDGRPGRVRAGRRRWGV